MYENKIIIPPRKAIKNENETQRGAINLIITDNLTISLILTRFIINGLEIKKDNNDNLIILIIDKEKIISRII